MSFCWKMSWFVSVAPSPTEIKADDDDANGFSDDDDNTSGSEIADMPASPREDANAAASEHESAISDVSMSPPCSPPPQPAFDRYALAYALLQRPAVGAQTWQVCNVCGRSTLHDCWEEQSDAMGPTNERWIRLGCKECEWEQPLASTETFMEQKDTEAKIIRTLLK